MRGVCEDLGREPGRAGEVRRGFTLPEILVVILIITLISAVALPTVLPAIGRRQVSEAARVLQGSLVGARDKAIRDGQPSGIRLLPDPAYLTFDPTTGKVDPAAILAYNRIIPIEAPPQYTDGRVTVQPPSMTYAASIHDPDGDPKTTRVVLPTLILEEAPVDAQGAPNPPTSWGWNVRVGDRVQVEGAGPWYTVVGPIWTANPEGFVNWGPAGTPSPYNPTGTRPIEWLILADGRDDDHDGFVDEGFDGFDNNGNGAVDEYLEWDEAEEWPESLSKLRAVASVRYAIRRRPAPVANAREVVLPSAMVVDATTWATTTERSRLFIDPRNGFVDLMINPDGTAYPSLPYGVPSSIGMGETYHHFWLADRSDLVAPSTAPLETIGGVSRYLPNAIGSGYVLLSIDSRTGRVVSYDSPPFDDPATALAQGRPYQLNLPYLPAMRGAR